MPTFRCLCSTTRTSRGCGTEASPRVRKLPFFVATLRHDGQIQGGASFTCAARLATASAVRSSRTTPLAMLLR